MKKKISLLLLFFSLSFYGQNDTISVVKTSDISVVSADKMNVVYRGLQNPISIAVPDCKSFTATGNGLYKYAEGKYQLIPGSGIETTIKIEIILKDESTKIEEHKFRIKTIPFIYGSLNNSNCKNCIVELSKTELSHAIIGVKSNMDYDILNLDVKSFFIQYTESKGYFVFGNSFDQKSINAISKLKTGTIFKINQVSIKNDDSNARCFFEILPIKVMVVD